jgi:steroid 5-alpha reductase family enzyme
LWFLTAQAFAIQILAYIPAVIFETEKFYDLVGSLTFLSVMVVATATNPSISATQWIAASMITIWAGRLGFFLFMRAYRDGGDSRFEKIKKSWSMFLVVWLMQGLWVVLLLGPLMVVMTAGTTRGLGAGEIVGIVVWVVGFII